MTFAQFPHSRFRSTLCFTLASVWSLAYFVALRALIASEPLAKGIQDKLVFHRRSFVRMNFVGVRFLIGIAHRRITVPEFCDVPAAIFHGSRFALLTARRKKRLADICVSKMKTEI
jgi:hypothetical protein